jgi:competence protein ComEC
VLFDRPSISLRNIALSALLIISFPPRRCLAPSFQMSFAATLALVAGYAIWTKRPYRQGPVIHPVIRPVFTVLRFFGGIALTSVIGGFSTALFSIEHFHRLSAYGLPANLMAMPVISFIVMPMGMLAMLLTPLRARCLPWKAAGLGLDVVIAIAKMVSGWGGTVDIGRCRNGISRGRAGFLLLTLLRTRLRYVGCCRGGFDNASHVLLPSAPRADLAISEDGTLVAVVTGCAWRPIANVHPISSSASGREPWRSNTTATAASR